MVTNPSVSKVSKQQHNYSTMIAILITSALALSLSSTLAEAQRLAAIPRRMRNEGIALAHSLQRNLEESKSMAFMSGLLIEHMSVIKEARRRLDTQLVMVGSMSLSIPLTVGLSMNIVSDTSLSFIFPTLDGIMHDTHLLTVESMSLSIPLTVELSMTIVSDTSHAFSFPSLDGIMAQSDTDGEEEAVVIVNTEAVTPDEEEAASEMKPTNEVTTTPTQEVSSEMISSSSVKSTVCAASLLGAVYIMW